MKTPSFGRRAVKPALPVVPALPNLASRAVRTRRTWVRGFLVTAGWLLLLAMLALWATG